MFGKRSFRSEDKVNPLRKQGVAAVILVLVLALQSPGLRAELFFRSIEQVAGQQSWSPVRKYSNPSDIAYARDPANGPAVHAQEVHIFLSGDITPADVVSTEVMAGLLKSGKQKIADNTVWLAGDGGDIDAGMAVGRLLRKLGVFTLVARNDQCLSACVFAFMGGQRRSVAGRLGIHRPFFPSTRDTPDRQASFRHMENVLKDFVEELDFPASLYEAVMLVPPESMQIVAPADLKRFYLEGISPSTEDMLDAASARRLGISMFEYLQRKAKAPPCAFLDAGRGRCEGRVLEAAASDGATDNPGNMQKGEAAATPVTGESDNRITQGPQTRGGTSHGVPNSS